MIAIAYEVTSLAVSPYGGIAQSCFHTLRMAATLSNLNPVALYRHGHRGNVHVTPAPTNRTTILSRLTVPRFDIVHALCHRLPPVRSKKIVYTLHDVWSLYPNEYQGAAFQKRLAKRMRRDISRADMIVADSGWTRQRLLALGLVGADRVCVVPLGVTIPPVPASAELSEAVRQVLTLRYVLFVGRIENRKNLGHVVDAVRSVPHVSLVIVGEPGFGYDDIAERQLSRVPPDRLRRFARLAPSDLAALYQNAVATLLPSWEEGFGLPVLEAMAAGSPVITSNRTACSEVAGDDAILVEPDNPNQSSDALARLLDDALHRGAMIEKGKQRASMFSWERYMQSLLTVYEKSLAV